MLLKVVLKGTSNLLLNFGLLISGHSLSVFNQGILVIRHVNSIQSVAKNSRLNPAELQQGFSIVEISFSTLGGHLPLVLGHDLTSQGAVGDSIRDGMNQEVSFAFCQQLLGMLKAIRSSSNIRHSGS